jgi:hypothetical protein
VPQDQSPGKLQLTATFNTGPLSGVVTARRELEVVKKAD